MQTNKLIDVQRQLAAESTTTSSDLNAILRGLEEGYGAGMSWDKVLEHRVCLLIGRANTGKTSELSLLKDRLHGQGKKTFLLPLRGIYETKEVERQLLPTEATEYLSWKKLPNDEAIFLLDSIDEAVLFHERAFLDSLRTLRNELGEVALAQCRWVISTRPGSWSSASTVSRIVDELCPPAQQTITSPTATDDAFEVVPPAQGVTQPTVVLAALRPLSEAQSKEILKNSFGVPQPDSAITLARTHGLVFAVQTPGDLKWLAELVKSNSEITSRTDAFEKAVAALIRTRPDEMQGSSIDDVMAEVEALAAAAVLCKCNSFALREAMDSKGSLSLSSLLGHKSLSFEKTVCALPLMSDAGMERVRFLPEVLQFFLAAKWLQKRCKSTADQVALIDLFVRETLAGPIVSSHLNSVAGWLSSWLPEFRNALFEFAPHALTFMGDLSRVSVKDSEKFVKKSFDLLARGVPLTPEHLTLTIDDFWHIARPELHDTLVQCFEKKSGSEMAAVHLLKIFASRSVPTALGLLKAYVLRPNLSDRLIRLAVEAITVCGSKADVEEVIRALHQEKLLKAQLAEEIAVILLEQNMAPEVFALLLDELTVASYGIDFYLTSEGQEYADLRCLEFAEAALKGNSQTHASAAAALLEGLLRSKANVASQYQRILVALEKIRSIAATASTTTTSLDDLAEAVDKHPTLKSMALPILIKSLPQNEWYLLVQSESPLYVTYKKGDLELISALHSSTPPGEGKELLAILKDYLSPTPAAEQVEAVPASTGAHGLSLAAKSWLEENKVAIRVGQDPNVMSQLPGLTALRPKSRYSLADWDRFEKDFGSELADVVKSGLMLFWRNHPPRYDPELPSQTYHQTVAGLMGLQLELEKEEAIGALSAAEAQRAFDYSIFELNDFPDWVAPLAKRYPTEFDAFATKNIQEWNSSSTAKQHAQYLLYRMRRGTTFTPSQGFIRAVWSAVAEGAWGEHRTLEHALSMVASNRSLIEEDLEVSARRTVQAAWDGNAERLDLWMLFWAILNTPAAVSWVHRKSTQEGEASHKKIGDFAMEWRTSHELKAALDELQPAKAALVFERMYQVLSSIVPPGSRPFIPGIRTRNRVDELDALRDAMVNQLGTIRDSAAFEAIQRLATNPTVIEPEMRWLHKAAFAVAERAGAGKDWSVEDFKRYKSDSETPLSDPQSLWKAITRDVDHLIGNLSSGEFSIRGMLNHKEAREADFQIALAREMELLSRGRYSVTREQELADGTSPDVTASSNSGHLVRLELKIGDKRQLEDLTHDLKEQLFADYLRSSSSNHGLFIVMWKDSSKNLASRRKLETKVGTFAASLRNEATRLTESRGEAKRVEVRCFICPKPKSDRNIARAAKRAVRGN